MSDFSVDLREFNEAIALRESRGAKTLVAITNDALRNVAYRSAQFTEETASAKIRAELKDTQLLARITAIRLRGKKVSDFKGEMEKTKRIRLASVRYLRSGFAPIIRALGGKFRGGRSAKLEAKFSAAQSGIHSTGSLATESDATAAFTWIIDEPGGAKASGAERKVFPAVQQAIDFVARDMINHDIDRMNKALA